MKRVIIDILIFCSIGFVLFILPVRIEKQGLELFLFKVMLVSAGFLHAHIVRKLAFPKIDWNKDEKKFLKILVIALYVIFIWAYARGG